MKKSTLLFTFAIAFMVFGCSEKSVTHSEPKEEKSVKESLAEELLMEFQGDLESWNACIVYDGKEYTSLEDFRNRDK
jgi:hypothetical protein